MKVEVAVLGSLSLAVLMVSVDVKQHCRPMVMDQRIPLQEKGNSRPQTRQKDTLLQIERIR